MSDINLRPARFRKVAVVEAMQILPDHERNENLVSDNSLSIAAISGWMTYHDFRDFKVTGGTDGSAYGLSIKSLEGWVEAGPGDWVVMGSVGEFWRVRGDIFATTYAAAEDD
jgi:hypothetical protein